MQQEEIINILTSGLKIEIEDTLAFGPKRRIKVILYLEGVPISSDSFLLQESEP
jgi:hypothetical protein